LHRAGIEVILDVVFNRTDEGNELGPTESFRGYDNRAFYVLDPSNPAVYTNLSGTGNTFNANHPLPQKTDRRLPAALGGRDARRWVPVR